jgi:hypothetical protein
VREAFIAIKPHAATLKVIAQANAIIAEYASKNFTGPHFCLQDS